MDFKLIGCDDFNLIDLPKHKEILKKIIPLRSKRDELYERRRKLREESRLVSLKILETLDELSKLNREYHAAVKEYRNRNKK